MSITTTREKKRKEKVTRQPIKVKISLIDPVGDIIVADQSPVLFTPIPTAYPPTQVYVAQRSVTFDIPRPGFHLADVMLTSNQGQGKFNFCLVCPPSCIKWSDSFFINYREERLLTEGQMKVFNLRLSLFPHERIGEKPAGSFF